MKRLGWLVVCPVVGGCAFHVDGGAILERNGTGGPAVVESLMTVRGHGASGSDSLGSLGMNIRTHASASGYDMGWGPEVCVGGMGDALGLGLCSGASFLTYSYRDGQSLARGTMSPYLTPTFTLSLDDAGALFLSFPVGWDQRFGAESGWYGGVTLGYGYVTED